jgi:excisionase family DNA binding protein
MVSAAAAVQRKPDANEPYLTPDDLVKILKKSKDWIRRRCAENTLPHRKVGRDYRFVRSEIDAWVDGQSKH